MRLTLRTARRSMLAAVILSLFVFMGTPPPQPVSAAPAWLDYVNSLRANANLPPVTENTTWSAEDLAHGQYMVINNVIGHSETPGMPGYSVAGDTAAQNGNVAISIGNTNYTYQNAIDSWMTGPFHAVGIIDPRLAVSGFGLYTDFNRQFPDYNAGAALDVLRGRTAAPTYPVFFPGNGKQMPYKTYDGNESPDPLTACPGYTAPTGPPLMILFAATPTINSATLTRDGTPGSLELCPYTELTYTNPDAGNQSLGRGVLSGRHAVVIMPRLPFTDGTYRLTVNNNGTVSNVVFGVGAPVKTLQSITVTPATPNLKAGNTLQFTATGTYSDASTQNLTNSVTWASSVPGFATITAGGLATGVAAGATTISATSGVIVGQTTLNVFVPTLQSITVTPANIGLRIGNTLQFTATGMYSDNSTQNLTGAVTWASSVPGFATITAGGLATAVAPGATTISATSGVIVGQTMLNVTVDPVPPGTRYEPPNGPPPGPTQGQNRGGSGGGLGPVDVKPASRP